MELWYNAPRIEVSCKSVADKDKLQVTFLARADVQLALEDAFLLMNSEARHCFIDIISASKRVLCHRLEVACGEDTLVISYFNFQLDFLRSSLRLKSSNGVMPLIYHFKTWLKPYQAQLPHGEYGIGFLATKQAKMPAIRRSRQASTHHPEILMLNAKKMREEGNKCAFIQCPSPCQGGRESGRADFGEYWKGKRYCWYACGCIETNWTCHRYRWSYSALWTSLARLKGWALKRKRRFKSL